MSKGLDQIDRAIIESLDEDSRASLANVGKRVGLSGPSVGERLRRLLDDGVIERFGLQVDLQALGYSMEAIVRIKPRSQQQRHVERMIREEPRFTTCDRVTGDDCLIARLAIVDVAELDEVLLPLHDYAETHTSIIKSSIVRGRLPDLNPLK